MKGMNSRVGPGKDHGLRGHKGEFINSSGKRGLIPDEDKKLQGWSGKRGLIPDELG